MRRISRWLNENADPLAALVAALALCFLDVFGVVSLGFALNGLLTVLALMAVAILRDRWFRDRFRVALESATERFNTSLTSVDASLSELSGRLATVEAIEATLVDARQVLRSVAAVETVTNADITRELAQARLNPGFWYFKGGTGAFMRDVTLPQCVEGRPSDLEVTIEIIDPTELALCVRCARSQATYSATRDDDPRSWTVERVRNEVYATVLAACGYRERFPFLRIRLGLSATMSTFRWDMSAEVLLITQDDARVPGQLIRRSSHLYALYQSELRRSLDQATPVPLRLADGVLGPTPTAEEVRRVFRLLGFPPDHFTDAAVEAIMEKAGFDVLVS